MTRNLFGIKWGKTSRFKWRSRGDELRDAGRWAEAAEAYGRHLEERPADTGIWIQHGHMLKEAGRLDEAIQSYNRSEELDAGDADRDVHLFHLRQRIAERANVEASAPLEMPEQDAHAEVLRPSYSHTRTVVPGAALSDRSALVARLKQTS